MISTTHAQQGGVHSRLERAKGYIHEDGTSLTPPPTSTADGRDVTAAVVTTSSVVSPHGAASTTEMIEEESTEDVAHLLTIVADIAAREAPLPIPGDDDVFFRGGRQPPSATSRSAGQPRIRAVSMASPDLRPHPPPSTPIGGVYSLTSPPSPQRIPPSPAMANDFRPPIRRHGAPIQERSYVEEQDNQGQLPEQPPAYSYSSSSSSDEGGQYLWSATAGPREQRQPHISSLTSTPTKKKKKTTTSRHRHRSAPAPAVAAAAPRRPASIPKRRQPRPNPGSGGGGGSRKVLHKKFSWKNYPEVSYLVTSGALISR